MKTQTTLSMIEKVSAVTLRVANMEACVRFYKDVLGLEIIYGGEGSYFTSLRTKDGDTILNLEHGNAGIQWGRLIFHVSDVGLTQSSSACRAISGSTVRGARD
jgi:catechol 2,3-dioxygenase-like lactoylglutathione lyase family enzyme